MPHKWRDNFILLVEVNLEAIRKIKKLVGDKYRYVIYQNFHQAYQFFEKAFIEGKYFDMVIVCPGSTEKGMDVVAFVERIRRLQKNQPIVALTASRLKRESLEEAGVTTFTKLLVFSGTKKRQEFISTTKALLSEAGNNLSLTSEN